MIEGFKLGKEFIFLIFSLPMTPSFSVQVKRARLNLNDFLSFFEVISDHKRLIGVSITSSV